MAYTNDPRESLIFGPDGQLWEQDNRVEDRWKWNGQWLDLCGLSPEDYSKTIFIVSGATPATPSKTANTITITTVGTTAGTYELEFTFKYPPTDDVQISLDVNGNPVLVNVPSGSRSYKTTNVGLAYPYATITNVRASSNDELYTYEKITNNVEEGIFTVTYYLNNAVYTSYTEYIGTTLPVPTLEEREGYTLNNWDVEYPIMPANGGEAHASYVINYYPLSINGVEIESVAYGSIITFNDYVSDAEYLDASKYTFEWQYADGTPVGVNSLPMPVGGLSVYEHADAKSYILKYVDYNDSALASETYKYKEAITLPVPTPTREGYTFVKWDKTTPATMPNHDVVIKAVYKINQYTLTYEYTKEGSATPIFYSAITQNYGTSISIVAPHEIGYTFEGWDVEYATMPATSTTVTTELKARVDNVVYLRDEDGNVLPDGAYDDLKAGETYSYDVTKAAREGYTIDWSVASMNENGTFTVPFTDDASITITATYIPNEYDVYVNGNIVAGKVTYGTVINLNDYCTDPDEYLDNTKYEFTWLNEDGEAIANPTAYTVPAKDVKITENAVAKEYTLTFKGFGGAVISEESVAYKSAIVTPANPEETGYDFIGWSPEYVSGDTMPNHDVTYEAQFEIHVLTLTINYAEGQSALTKDIEFNAEVDVTAYVPEIFAALGADSEDYNLVWKDAEGAETTVTTFNMPDADVTMSLEYSLKIFTLTYRVEDADGLITAATKQYSVEVTKPLPVYPLTASEIKGEEGWSLGAWDKQYDVMPRKDVELTAMISKIPVNIDVIFKVETTKGNFDITTAATVSVNWGEAYTAPVPEYSTSTHVLNWSVVPAEQEAGLNQNVLTPVYTTEKIIMTATVSIIPSKVFYGMYLNTGMTALNSIDEFVAFNAEFDNQYDITGAEKAVNFYIAPDPVYDTLTAKQKRAWETTHNCNFLVFVPQGKVAKMRSDMDPETTNNLSKIDLGKTFTYEGGNYDVYIQYGTYDNTPDGEAICIQYNDPPLESPFPMIITVE